METINFALEPLEARLNTFLTPVKYDAAIVDYRYYQVIERMKQQIHLFTTNDIQKIQHIRNSILNLRNSYPDLSKLFFEEEVIDVTTLLDLHEQYPDHVEKQEISDEWVRVKINKKLAAELEAYSTLIDLVLQQVRKHAAHKIAKETFSINGSEVLLDATLDSLKNNGFILKSTTLNHFQKMFSGKKPPPKPLIWVGTIAALHYFVDELYERGIVDIKTEKIKWDITKTCFEFDDPTKSMKYIDKPGKLHPKQKLALEKILITLQDALAKHSRRSKVNL